VTLWQLITGYDLEIDYLDTTVAGIRGIALADAVGIAERGRCPTLACVAFLAAFLTTDEENACA